MKLEDMIERDHEYENISDNIIVSLQRYLDKGMPPGSFLSSVLENDLFQAVAHADPTRKQNLSAIAKFIYNSIPSKARGSKEKVDNIINNGGI